jgi:hypothetical protein
MLLYVSLRATVIVMLVGLGGCTAASTDPGNTAEDPEAATSINGVSLNGVSLNGVSLNGVSLNGLSVSGLATAQFSLWFNQNATTSETTMEYVVKCAYSATSSLSWTNPFTQVLYTWPGELGLTPGWASGAPMTTLDQQIITACLLAHANKYGVHVPIAVEGLMSTGAQIPMISGELTTYSVTEGAFFGNSVTGSGYFSCLDHGTWDAAQSSARACAFWTQDDGTNLACAPIFQVGACSEFCTLDPTHVYHPTCTYGGTTYVPITTRLMPSAIYWCGDGICEFTEQCGTGTTVNNCQLDCGLCP